MILIDRAAPAGSQAPKDASADARAAALDATLASLDSLEDRIRAIAAAVPGRIAFSSSLGIEDQAVTHAIAEANAKSKTAIDIFTLDTGRHFPETYDTLFETEGRYGFKIRVMYPDAADVENLIESDGIYGFRYSVDPRPPRSDSGPRQ